MSNNTENNKQNENMGCGQRAAMSSVFVIAGLICFGVNLHYILNSGWYNPNLSYYGGGAIAIGLFIALFGGTDFKFNALNVVILILVLVIAFAIGAIFNMVFVGQIH